jgi:hypothetical protein
MLGSPSVKLKIVSDQDEEKTILGLPKTKKTPKNRGMLFSTELF